MGLASWWNSVKSAITGGGSTASTASTASTGSTAKASTSSTSSSSKTSSTSTQRDTHQANWNARQATQNAVNNYVNNLSTKTSASTTSGNQGASGGSTAISGITYVSNGDGTKTMYKNGVNTGIKVNADNTEILSEQEYNRANKGTTSTSPIAQSYGSYVNNVINNSGTTGTADTGSSTKTTTTDATKLNNAIDTAVADATKVNAGTITKNPTSVKETVDKTVEDTKNTNTNTTGTSGTLSEGEFNKSTAMQSKYGNYTNYKNGVTLAQQAAKIGRLSDISDWENPDTSDNNEDNSWTKNLLDAIGYDTSKLPTSDDWLGFSGDSNNFKISNPLTLTDLQNGLTGLKNAAGDAWNGLSGLWNNFVNEINAKDLPTGTTYTTPTGLRYSAGNITGSDLQVDPTGFAYSATPAATPVQRDYTDLSYLATPEQFASTPELTNQFDTYAQYQNNYYQNYGGAGDIDTGTKASGATNILNEKGLTAGSTEANTALQTPGNFLSNFVMNNLDNTEEILKGDSDAAARQAIAEEYYNALSDSQKEVANQNILNYYSALYPNTYAAATAETETPEDTDTDTDKADKTGGNGGSGGGGSYVPSGGSDTTTTNDYLYSMPEVTNYATQSILNKLLPTNYAYDYNQRNASRLADIDAAQQSYIAQTIPTIANTYQDQAANTLANLISTLRANRASGLTSGASRGAQAAQDVQAVQSANSTNASNLNELINTNLASYLQTLAGKRATSGSDTATELNSYYSPMVSALSNILGYYNYGSAAAQVNNGGLQRQQSYLV